MYILLLLFITLFNIIIYIIHVNSRGLALQYSILYDFNQNVHGNVPSQNMCSEKDEEISKLRDEVITLRESLQQLSPEDNLLIPSRLSPRTSPPQPRPHSVHFDAGGLHSQSELLLRDKTPSDDETPNGSQLCLNED